MANVKLFQQRKNYCWLTGYITHDVKPQPQRLAPHFEKAAKAARRKAKSDTKQDETGTTKTAR